MSQPNALLRTTVQIPGLQVEKPAVGLGRWFNRQVLSIRAQRPQFKFPRTHVKNYSWWLVRVIPMLGWWKQENPWDSLVS